MIRLFLCFISLLLLSCPPAAADAWNFDRIDAEVHAVGIYEGRLQRSGAPQPRPDVRIVVDRSDRTVILLLGAFEPTRWVVETSEGTEISQIILHGHGQEGSEAWLNGMAFANVKHSNQPSTFQPFGEDFRALIANIPALTGEDRLDNFIGAYASDETGFVIEGRPALNPTFDENYLQSELLKPDQIPGAFAPILAQVGRGEQPMRDVVLTDQGFVLDPDNPGATVTHAVNQDVPAISWPVDAAVDPVSNALYGVSLGGEGFLYVFDLSQGVWSVASSMNGVDASGMIYDSTSQRMLIVTGGRYGHDNAALLFFARNGEKTKTPLNMDLFAGYTDIFDVGNEPEPSLIPLAVYEDKLLLIATTNRHLFLQGRGQLQPRYRAYVVSMTSGAVGLAAYDGISALAPEPW
jgi:hypothetical protein